ncbi:ssDNA-binding protein, mitochondrial, partial [Teratosphaeriaceae sp. CCFEE 6253]
MYSLRALPRAAHPSLRAFSTTAPRPLAKMQLIGRLADTPEVTPTSTGRDIIRYALGVSTGRRDEDGNRG